MKNLGRRALRHLSFANLLACLALFVALGGVGYAATTINGNKIVKQSIGAGKLKKGTLSSAQVKPDGLDGSVIDEATLTIVPAAQTATSAQSATKAQSAASATTADTATSAKSADTAEAAESLDGFTADELQLSCPPATSLFGGVCWDDEVRPFKLWIAAAIECGENGGRLPILSELIAYVSQPGTQVTGPNWSADVIDLPVSGKEHVLTRDETTTESSLTESATFGFRCVFYRSN